MIQLVTQFGAAQSSGSSGLGALGVDGKAFIIQLITFLLAFLVLKKWAFKPILKVLDERRRTIDNGVKLGDDMKKQQAALDQKVTEVLQDARKQADGIIAGSEATAREVANEVEAKARKKADGILQEADSRITQDMARARQKLSGELVSLVSDATEAIINEKIDAKKDAALIDRALGGRS